MEVCKLALTANQYPVSGLPVDFARKKQMAQPSGLFMEEGLQAMMKAKTCYAIYSLFPFIAAFIDRRHGFVESRNLIRMSVLCTEMVN